MNYESVKPGTWVGGEEAMEAAQGKIADWLSTEDLAVRLGVSRSRVMSLIRRGRLLARKFTTKSWAIPVDAEGKPWMRVPDNGPQPGWVDRVNAIRYRYRSGPVGKSVSDTLDEIEKRLEELTV